MTVYVRMHAGERAEIEAMRDLWKAAPDPIGAEFGLCEATGGAIAFYSNLQPGVRELTRVLGLMQIADLDTFESFFREGGVPRYWISLMPGTALETELERRGYTPDYAWMKFSRPAGDAPDAHTDLRVEEVGADRALDFAATAAEAYGVTEDHVPWLAALPGRAGWACIVSYEGDRPVGTGALFAHEDVAWFGFAATLPEARGRGSQSAILAHRIVRAAELGCETCVTETGERVPDRPSGSYRNILRAGFGEAYLRPNWRSPVEAAPLAA